MYESRIDKDMEEMEEGGHVNEQENLEWSSALGFDQGLHLGDFHENLRMYHIGVLALALGWIVYMSVGR